jgi:hypothetical protein
MIEFLQLAPIECRANAKRARSAIVATGLIWLTCKQGNLHAPPKMMQNYNRTVRIADRSIGILTDIGPAS